MQFTETELGIISNALRVAAEKFRDNASELQRNYGNSRSPEFGRIAAEFSKQQFEADRLYSRIATETGVAS